jgi:Tfp pilus assembly protein PilF
VPFAALRALGEGLAAREADARVQGLRRALAIDPDYEEASLALARLLADAGRFEEARQTLARVSRQSSFAREALFLEGPCLIGLGRPAEADVLYAGLATQQPTAAVLVNRSAARLRLATGASGASTLMRQALDQAPFATDLPFGLGWALLVEGDPAAAAFWLRTTVRYAPSDAAGRLALSWALITSGRSEEAEEQWRAAAALDPSLASQRQPDLTRRLERPLASESGLFLDSARAADAREARVHEARGDALLAAGDAAAAAAELERAVSLDPTAAQGHRLLARAAVARGDREKAIAELRTALLCRDDPVLRRDLAELLRAAGREAEARRVLGEP